MQILSHLILQKSQLESLAIISQSKSAVVQLLESALPHVLSQCVAEFCNHQIFLNGHKEHISNVAECTQHHRCRCNNEGSDVAPCPVDSKMSACIYNIFLFLQCCMYMCDLSIGSLLIMIHLFLAGF